MSYNATNNCNPMNAESNMDEFISMMKQFRNIMESYEKKMKDIPKHPSREESLSEAVQRMEKLGFQPDDIAEFRKNGEIRYVMEDGHCLPLSELDRSQIQKLKNQGFVVYAAIRNNTIFGRMTAYIVVAKYGEDWLLERENLNRNNLMAYVYNHDIPFCSEWGTINIKRLSGGIFDRIV